MLNVKEREREIEGREYKVNKYENVLKILYS
jgi:hypothetical protein